MFMAIVENEGLRVIFVPWRLASSEGGLVNGRNGHKYGYTKDLWDDTRVVGAETTRKRTLPKAGGYRAMEAGST